MKTNKDFKIKVKEEAISFLMLAFYFYTFIILNSFGAFQLNTSENLYFDQSVASVDEAISFLDHNTPFSSPIGHNPNSSEQKTLGEEGFEEEETRNKFPSFIGGNDTSDCSTIFFEESNDLSYQSVLDFKVLPLYLLYHSWKSFIH